MATNADIEAAKERHCRVVAGEQVTDVYARSDGVFSDYEHFEIANGMHSTDCKILANELVSQQSQPIDETKTMPAFVGDDEIKIAGVVYMRKDKHQLDNEQLRAALGLRDGEKLISGKDGSYLVETPAGNRKRLGITADEYAELERLKYFEKCVTDAMQWAGQTCKEMVELALVELRIKRGEIID